MFSVHLCGPGRPHFRTAGATLRPLSCRLLVDTCPGPTPADLASYNRIAATIIDAATGATVLDETTDPITIADASDGRLELQWPDLPPGRYLVYFRCYGQHQPTLFDVYPTSAPESNRLLITVAAAV